jgi:hypothetical protein
MPNADANTVIRNRHNITLSDPAWQYLDHLTKVHPAIKSRCSAIEFLIDFYAKRNNEEKVVHGSKTLET